MIYKILNNTTGDFYIGYTSKSLEERFKRHVYAANAGTKTHLHSAMRKYGVENFSIECLQLEGNLNEDEALWIAQLKPKYNMTLGGDGGDTSNSSNFIQYVKNRRSYNGDGNPNYGKRGEDSPKSQKVLLDGIVYCSISEARKKAKRSFKYVKTNGIFI